MEEREKKRDPLVGWARDRHPTRARARPSSPSLPAAGGEGRGEEARSLNRKRQNHAEPDLDGPSAMSPKTADGTTDCS